MAGNAARKRERLFDDFSKRLARARGEPVGPFLCPLCGQTFLRAALEKEPPDVSLAHVVSEALSGGFCTLTCTRCNNDLGSELEAYLIERFRAEDALRGTGRLAGRLEGPFGSVGVEVEVTQAGGPWSLFVIEPQSHPIHVAELNAALDAPADDEPAKISVKLQPHVRHQPKRVTAALYQSAYLLMFAYFGYDVVFDERFAKLREQILKPDDEILPAAFPVPPDEWAAQNLNAERPHAIMFVKEPASEIRAMFRMQPLDGLPRVLSIRLPGLDDPQWPTAPANGHTKGVLVRFRPENDDGARPTLRDLWERAKSMPMNAERGAGAATDGSPGD